MYLLSLYYSSLLNRISPIHFQSFIRHIPIKHLDSNTFLHLHYLSFFGQDFDANTLIFTFITVNGASEVHISTIVLVQIASLEERQKDDFNH